MKKICTLIISILIILLATTIIIFSLHKDNKENNLTKVTVADTTLTSRTYMSWFNQYIWKLIQTKYAI